MKIESFILDDYVLLCAEDVFRECLGSDREVILLFICYL